MFAIIFWIVGGVIGLVIIFNAQKEKVVAELSQHIKCPCRATDFGNLTKWGTFLVIQANEPNKYGKIFVYYSSSGNVCIMNESEEEFFAIRTDVEMATAFKISPNFILMFCSKNWFASDK